MKLSFIIQQLQDYHDKHKHDDVEFEVAIRSKREEEETVLGTKFVALEPVENIIGNVDCVNLVTLVTERE